MATVERDTALLTGDSRSNRWRRSERALWRIVMDDAVVVRVDSDQPPFALSGGARLWRLLAEPRSLDELAEDLGAGGHAGGLEGLLDSLTDAGVVERIEG